MEAESSAAEIQRLQLNELAFTPRTKVDPRFARPPPPPVHHGVSLPPALAGVTMKMDPSIGVVSLTTCWRNYTHKQSAVACDL